MVESMGRFNIWKEEPECVKSIHSFLDVISGKNQKLQVVTLICDGGCIGGDDDDEGDEGGEGE